MARALEDMHHEVANTSDQRRIQARARQAARSKPPNFAVGDFVLVAGVLPLANKLAIKWQGPKRIVRAVTAWIFEVEDLNPPQHITAHHVSRIRLFAETDREVTEDMLQYALHSQGGHCVEAYRDVRLNSSTRQ
ncbi:hypothetical protein GN244_ATG20937 [Phytophthora infestans]|uniref:Uncharacterized protein n=1 Tax=Phytophthora infestans TaxID=4787 RepID=A0A833S5C8_PHYIN|nr:hypothetical protein GN244_ATG20937 [Phytophthora infestans]